MSIEFIVLIVVIVAGFAGLFWFLARAKKEEPKKDDNSLLMLQNQLNELMRTMDSRLSESTKMFHEQSGTNTRIVQDVIEKLVRLEETNKQVGTFASQLQNLQDILKNPKQRGVLGEYYLETVLKNVLPPGSYEIQYKMGVDEKTNQELIVDAAVFVKDKIIPVDSKFSLENYERLLNTSDAAERERFEKLFKQDLKNRIDETSKYIQPGKGTMDFAFMFIPSESIYYDLLVNKVGAVQISTQDLIEYAFKEKHVIIVSPTSFLAYLQTVLQGLRALQVEESVKEIIKNAEVLKKHLTNHDSYMEKLGKHMETTVNTYNTAYRELKKVDKDIYRITGDKMNIEPRVLQKPTQEEG